MQASHFPNHPMQTGLQRNMHPSIDGPAFQMNQINNQQPQHVPGNVSMPIMQASKLNLSNIFSFRSRFSNKTK